MHKEKIIWSRWIVVLALIATLAVPLAGRAAPVEGATLFQTSTIQALGLGLYDGKMTFGKVLKHGNLGLGTCQALDGEVVILDGNVYQLRSDGTISEVPSDATTPFAMVTPFMANKTITITNIKSLAALEQELDSILPTPNIPYAFKITGAFESLTARSVPAQHKPYPPLSEAVQHQSEFTFENVTGTLVGFRMPAFLGQVNVPGYHFHFLTADRKRGGHVLKMQVQRAVVQVQYIRNFQLNLPDLRSFDKADFSEDQSEALHKAESAR